ncbi:MAG: aspartate aminotransferase family protein [Oscillospiraceae bacterium]|jgi:4-aminobutyrate aminotransferase|nr:aspartate aminotransferase family protein [Oscillospiraceae bacterium]MCI1990581.1 aspartate aminotransferase family protein [Oscillospiraceae bacterium]MCI2036281.1 aspartate aminotransferase family protein [Oscillospiraceae bacterium]
MKFEDYKQYLSPALAKATDLVITKGEGSYLYTESGEKYLDFVQGIAVNALGHCHPAVVKAVQEQAANLMNASFNLVNFAPTLKLAKRIAEKSPGDLGCTFFSNGGAEAIDGALKLAKAYTKRPAIIAFEGSFHGRTIGASTVTASNSKYRKYYEPMMGSVYFAPYPSKDLCPKGMDEEERSAYCLSRIQQLFDYIVAPEMVAAILMEPVQGEGGYVVPPLSFVQGVRKLCSEHGILLIFDEIQAGYGRTGKMFAGENFGVIPDIMTLGKAIGGGLPMSAVVSTPKIMGEWHPGMHGTTFGGNPVAAAAGNAVLDVFESTDILTHVNEMGAYLKKKLAVLKEKYSCISDVRGLGLMVAIEFSHEDGTPGGDIWAKVKQVCIENHLLTLNCGVHGNGLRFATCLNVTKDILDKGVGILDKSIESVIS